MRSRLVWSGLLLLVLLGVAASVSRTLALFHLAAPVTEARLQAARAMIPAYAEQIPQYEEHFAGTPGVTLVHVVTGALFLGLGLLQFAAGIRSRHLTFHRWSGRFLAALALFAGTTGLWLGLVAPFTPIVRLPTVAAGAIFLIAPAMAIAAIRRGDVARHREWMIRFFSIGVGIVVMRLVMPVLFWLLTPADFRIILGLGFWAGLIISVATAELWIRSSRADPAGHSPVAPIRAQRSSAGEWDIGHSVHVVDKHTAGGCAGDWSRLPGEENGDRPVPVSGIGIRPLRLARTRSIQGIDSRS